MFNSLKEFHQNRIRAFQDELLQNRADINVSSFNNIYKRRVDTNSNSSRLVKPPPGLEF